MTRGRARLRVAVSPTLVELWPRMGHGRMWRSVLPALAQLTDLRVATPGERAPDVWLADGHSGVLPGPGPVVAQVHEACWDDAELGPLFAPGFLASMKAATEVVVRGASGVITPSESARREVVRTHRVEPGRVHAVAHGVDHAVFNAAAGGGRARVAAALGRDVPYVLFAGTVHPRKNIGALRAAMAQLVRGGAPHALVLVLAGAPDREDSSALLAAAGAPLDGAPGRVVALSDVDDSALAGLMAEADAFCLPSFSEGFGLTVAEAMACGTAVVVADRGALPEVVGAAGVCAAPDAASVAAALEEVIGDPARRAELAAAGRERAAGLTWAATARGWLAVLEAAAAGAR